MKITTLFIKIIFVVGLLAMVITPAFIYADNHTKEYKSVLLPKNQTVNKDYFAAGETVILSGTVNGDAYLAGANVIVEGVVNGDLLAVGGTITIRGRVTQNVRVAGGQIIVSGTIGRNLTTAGGSVTVNDSAKISGSLTAGAGNLSIFAPIGKETNVGAGQLILANTINGDLQAGIGQLTLTPNAKVLGNLTYWSDQAAQVDTGARISGKVTHNLPPKPSKEQQEATKNASEGFSFVVSMFAFLSTLLIGLLFVNFLPVYTQQTATIVTQKMFLSLGIGLLALVCTPIIFVILMVTIIGIPLGFILLISFLIFVYLAKIFVAVAIGQKALAFFNKNLTLGWVFVVGLLIYSILTWIPILGGLFSFLVMLTGLGALLIERKYVYTELRKKKLI